MRALTVVLTPPEGSHLASQLFETGSGLTRERIYHLNVLEDGTVVLLGRVRGDFALAEQRLAERSDVLGYSVSNAGTDGGLVYVHARPPPVVRAFLDLPTRHEVFFEFPIEGTGDGRLRVTMLGETNAVLQRALAELPAAVDLAVERLGPYREGGDLTALLTERQREVLNVALDVGYYAVPREATHRDVADRLGLSVGTVAEHLQKVEARVFGELG